MSQRIGPKVNVNIEEETLALIEELATAAGVTKAEMFRNCLEVGIDLGLQLKKMGAFKVAEFVKSAREIHKRCTA